RNAVTAAAVRSAALMIFAPSSTDRQRVIVCAACFGVLPLVFDQRPASVYVRRVYHAGEFADAAALQVGGVGFRCLFVGVPFHAMTHAVGRVIANPPAAGFAALTLAGCGIGERVGRSENACHDAGAFLRGRPASVGASEFPDTSTAKGFSW